MRSIFIYIFLFISIQSFGQSKWVNLLEEDQAEKALEEENYPLAIQLYEKALEIRKAKYPDDGFHCNVHALREVSDALDNLIVAHNEAGNYEKRIELCEELSSWSEEGMRLYPHEPNTYLEYGFAQIKIAESYHSLKQYDKGLEVCQTLIRFFQNTGNIKPFKFVAKQIIPFTHARAGLILRDQERLEDSAIQHEKSIEALQNTLKEVQDEFIYEEIGKQSNHCVRRYEKLKDSTKMLKYAELAMKNYKILMNIDSSNEKYTKEVILIGNTLASYKSALGRNEEVIEHYHKSLVLNEKLFNQSGDPDYFEQMAAINLKLSNRYESLDSTLKSAQYLSARIEQLKQLRDLIPSTDYLYTISSNQYQLAKKYEALKQFPQALEAFDESIVFGKKAIERDPQNIRKKEWQWVQEFYRFQLLRDMEEYELAKASTERLIYIFSELEKLEEDIQYSEHIREMEISKRLLAYPEFIKMDAEIKEMEEGQMKFEKSMTMLKFLKKQMKKDQSLQLAFVKYSSVLGWSGLMIGEYKETLKVLKKAMKIKPVDPYLITNYAPCLLFLGKYKKADKVYAKNYEKPFRPGKKIIYGFIDDFDQFEEKGVIPPNHREKVDELKVKLQSWNTK